MLEGALPDRLGHRQRERRPTKNRLVERIWQRTHGTRAHIGCKRIPAWCTFAPVDGTSGWEAEAYRAARRGNVLTARGARTRAKVDHLLQVHVLDVGVLKGACTRAQQQHVETRLRGRRRAPEGEEGGVGAVRGARSRAGAGAVCGSGAGAWRTFANRLEFWSDHSSPLRHISPSILE